MLQRAEAKAQCLVEERFKGDKRKVRIAQRLRKETTMTAAWIAQPLRGGNENTFEPLAVWEHSDQK